MPTERQIQWVRDNIDVAAGPILDVGSRVPESRPGSKVHRYRLADAFLTPGEVAAAAPPGPIVGVDMIDGPNVDRVYDLAGGVRSKPTLKAALGYDQFATIYCLSVFEHAQNTFTLAANVAKLLAPGGWLFVSVPFTFRYHAHPDDYWRMTPQAVRHLFRGLEYCEARSEIWSGTNEQVVPDMLQTRAYADRARRTLDIVTINCAFTNPAKGKA